MKAVKVQFNAWDKPQIFVYENLELMVGDHVIVENGPAKDIGRVLTILEVEKPELNESGEEKMILRKATKEDLEVVLSHNKQKRKIFNDCAAMIKKVSLPIKLVDVCISFDDSRLTFAFIAEGRVDFRDLLKDLNKHFKKNIRLQQIGIRDEIKINGDIGCCGRNLCCQNFLKELGNVTSELADLQQVAHRGSERLSGVCGRLKCCLMYENSMYNELADEMPIIGDKIKTPHGRGEVIGWHVLRQTVDVLLEDKETIVEVPIEKN